MSTCDQFNQVTSFGHTWRKHAGIDSSSSFTAFGIQQLVHYCPLLLWSRKYASARSHTYTASNVGSHQNHQVESSQWRTNLSSTFQCPCLVPSRWIRCGLWRFFFAIPFFLSLSSGSFKKWLVLPTFPAIEPIQGGPLLSYAALQLHPNTKLFPLPSGHDNENTWQDDME